MSYGKHRTGYRIAMLLVIAASFVLHPDISAAAAPADKPDADCVALLNAAAGLPQDGKARKTFAKPAATPALTGGEEPTPPPTAAYAANLLRYDMGYLSVLPDASGALPVPTAQDTQAAVDRLLTQTLTLDAAPYVQQLRGKPLRQYRAYAENASAFIGMSEMVRVRTERAVEACMRAVKRDLALANVDAALPPAPYELPDWKRLAALYSVYGEKALTMLRDTLTAAVVETDGGATLLVRYGTYDDIASQGTRKQFIAARFAYAYLNTVYDGAGAEIAAQTLRYDAAYLAGVTHPVPGHLIKNGWFDPRDRGTRYHTGTDIRAPGGTRILSVTDGTVLYIGYLPVPGNYVIIRDPSGYEYHYYHLRERTQFVREGDEVLRGDVIGRVGNTGNSAANHLHLTVVSPTYTYCNPYDLFLQAGVTPIRTDE